MREIKSTPLKHEDNCEIQVNYTPLKYEEAGEMVGYADVLEGKVLNEKDFIELIEQNGFKPILSSLISSGSCFYVCCECGKSFKGEL